MLMYEGDAFVQFNSNLRMRTQKKMKNPKNFKKLFQIKNKMANILSNEILKQRWRFFQISKFFLNDFVVYFVEQFLCVVYGNLRQTRREEKKKEKEHKLVYYVIHKYINILVHIKT